MIIMVPDFNVTKIKNDTCSSFNYQLNNSNDVSKRLKDN